MVKKKADPGEYLRLYARYFGLTSSMIGVILLGGFAGHRLDLVINPGKPIFTTILIILGTALAFYLLFHTISKK